MPNAIDLSGRRFGRLTVVSFAGRRHVGGQSKRIWLCRCDCGNQINLPAGALTANNTRSCGCLMRDTVTVHGGYKDPIYKVWHAMIERCRNAKHSDYPLYGGRGIVVAAAWTDFAKFRLDMGPRPHGATLERIDVNGNYCKSNCRWATPQEQANNRRNNRHVYFNGYWRTIAEWSRITGLSKRCIQYRLSAGWPKDAVLTTPPDRNNRL